MSAWYTLPVLDQDKEDIPYEERLERPSMEMDAITAHLDRGWDLLSRGDLPAARLSADHILQIDTESPEGLALYGAIAAAEGEAEEAMEHFRRALEVDPEYVDAMFYAADLAIHPIGDVEYALQLCDEAEDVIGQNGEEMLDVWMLRAEAHLLAGRVPEAQTAISALKKRELPDASYRLRIGRAMIEADRYADAVEVLEGAVAHKGAQLDVHYFLGVALELQGQSKEAQGHFLAAHKLDREQSPLAWALELDKFEALVESVIAKMPEPLAEALGAVPAHVLDHPAFELVAEGFDPRSPVFFASSPAAATAEVRGKPRRRAVEPGSLQLSAVFVYRRNIERFVRGPAEIALELSRAIAQEAAFFYGYDEARLGALLEQIQED